MTYSATSLRMIIRTALTLIDLYSQAAEELLLGTAAQESNLGRYLVQRGGGPARGIMQVEPATERDNWHNFLRFPGQANLKARVTAATGMHGPDPLHLQIDPIYNTIMARIWYLRRPGRLPDADDLEGQANYWNDHYNINDDHGWPSEYIANYRRFVG